MDGSSHIANIDDEVFLVLWCDINGSGKGIQYKMNFFAVERLYAVTGQNIFNCLQGAMVRNGITE